MAYTDTTKKFRGQRAKIGNPVVTENGQIVFFAGYCEHNNKVCLSYDEAQAFSRRFHYDSKPLLIRIITYPSNILRQGRKIFRAARQIADSQL